MDDQQETYSARSKKTTHSKQSDGLLSKIVAGVVLLIIVGGLGFYGGVQYQKGHTSTKTVAAGRFSAAGAAGGQRGFARNGTFGSVTAITSSSITVQSDRDGTSKTYSITSDTTITNNGSTAIYSDIAVGDTVIVSASSGTSTVATRITVNPSMGGGPGGQTQQSTTNSVTN